MKPEALEEIRIGARRAILRTRIFIKDPGLFRAEVTDVRGRYFTAWGWSPDEAEVDALVFGLMPAQKDAKP